MLSKKQLKQLRAEGQNLINRPRVQLYGLAVALGCEVRNGITKSLLVKRILRGL